MRGTFSLGWFVSIGALIILAGLVVGFMWYQSVLANGLIQSLPQGQGSVVFTETGATEKFTLSSSDYTLLAEPAVHHNDAVILESAAMPGGSEQAVLAKVSGTPGVVLGVIHSNGNLEPIIADGSDKTDLQITNAGQAVYVVALNPVAWATDSALRQQTSDDLAIVDEQEGHATGPVASAISFSTTPAAGGVSASMLYAVDLSAKNPTPRSIGEGRSPRRRVDDSIIAITAQGIAKIDAATGRSSVLLPYPFGDAVGSTISEDGVTALLRTNGNSLLDAFRISGDKVTEIGSIVSRDPIYGASFTDGTHVFIRTGINSAALYQLTDAAGYPLPPTTHLTLVMSK